MKSFLIRYFWILLLLPALTACNNEDDLGAIFTRKKWKIVYLATTTNWNDPNRYTIQKAYDQYKEDANAYTVYFGENTIIIRGLTAEWTGTWSADAKNRTLVIDIQNKNHDGKTADEQEFMLRVANARYYQGDENLLKVFLPDKADFAQFTPSK